MIRYFRLPGGGVELVDQEGGAPYVPPDGAVELTEEEYRQELAAIEAARQAYQEQQEAEATAKAREDYLALKAAGLPEETARRLSGYTPPDDEGSDQPA
ncbi:hypothetical protein F5972_08040 [Microbispora cellulosiformans]|uniref:Uncharacterized protein n=1 Tax=Microbispora cellulosiformans TaxID=2614688 RepID=A0A5J5K5M3_9ACTN|nr:hypothetical protein [Microbispora cellulosiformans]KAA9379597.1 hypothetical protein F5972_08040 [Microbispora cellulosiformans]